MKPLVPNSMLAPSQNEALGPADLTLNAEVRRICLTEGGYPERWPRHQSCPCCGAGKIANLFSKNQFSHDQCGECGFVCVNPYPPEDIIEKLYSGAYYTNFREFYEARHLRESGGISMTSVPLELLEEMIGRATNGRESGKWLDIGGGLGTTADLIRRRRSTWTVALNELNPRSRELARQIYGLDVIGNSTDELRDLGHRFDVISAISVLEHITEPLSFLRSYAELLRDDGVFVLVVPQFTRLSAAVSKAASPVVTPPFHTSLFHEHNLTVLVSRVGAFEAVQSFQFGPPAFDLIHHYDVSDYWDITIPTLEEPVPKGFMLKEYPAEINSGLNALKEINEALGDYFAEVDGSLFLATFACKQAARMRDVVSATPRRPRSATGETRGLGVYQMAVKVARQYENDAAKIAGLTAALAEKSTRNTELEHLNATHAVQNEAYAVELARLITVIAERDEAYNAETARMNSTIAQTSAAQAAEIARSNAALQEQNEAHRAEIAELRSTEIRRVKIAEVWTLHSAAIARLKTGYCAATGHFRHVATYLRRNTDVGARLGLSRRSAGRRLSALPERLWRGMKHWVALFFAQN